MFISFKLISFELVGTRLLFEFQPRCLILIQSRDLLHTLTSKGIWAVHVDVA